MNEKQLATVRKPYPLQSFTLAGSPYIVLTLWLSRQPSHSIPMMGREILTQLSSRQLF